MNVIARWRAWRARRRHLKRLKIRLRHLSRQCGGSCNCKKRIKKLTPRGGAWLSGG